VTGGEMNLGLEKMLAQFGMRFEGRLHSGADDSRNIARLFLRLLPQLEARQLEARQLDSPEVEIS